MFLLTFGVFPYLGIPYHQKKTHLFTFAATRKEMGEPIGKFVSCM
jgi:hypothetical protein